MEISIDLTKEQGRIVAHSYLWESLLSHRAEYQDLCIDAIHCEDTQKSLLKRRKRLKKLIKAHRILLKEIKENE